MKCQCPTRCSIVSCKEQFQRYSQRICYCDLVLHITVDYTVILTLLYCSTSGTECKRLNVCEKSIFGFILGGPRIWTKNVERRYIDQKVNGAFASERRVGSSLRRVAPYYHKHRQRGAERQLNPGPISISRSPIARLHSRSNENWIRERISIFTFFFNWKMNSLNFNFHFFRKIEKLSRKIFNFHFYEKNEKWILKYRFLRSFSIFNKNEKWKWTKIFIFHFSNSKKNELALGYTHCGHMLCKSSLTWEARTQTFIGVLFA